MISLCMIVRDEAALLPGFLQAVDGLWDELCVADTGSTDETCRILEQAGARLSHFPWIDDFAAARNASLALATGDWVLYLDPDETPSPTLIAAIRALDGDPTAGAATVLMRNRRETGDYTETRLLRLFRRRPGIRFEHAIHESVNPTVNAMLAAENRALRHLPGHVDHVGYTAHWMQQRQKRQRDQAILETALTQRPDDLYSAHKLLELAHYWQDAALAQSTAERLLGTLSRLPADALARQHWGGDLLARLARTLGEQVPARALQILALRPVVPTLDYLETRGLFLETAGDLRGAETDFLAAITACEAERAPAATHINALLGLTRLALARGDLAACTSTLSRALELNPQHRLVLRYTLLLADLSGGKAQLMACCRDLQQRFGIAAALQELAPEFGLTVGEASGLAS